MKSIKILLFFFIGMVFQAPASAVFLSTDPVGYADQYNLYAYCNNDALNCVDPDGRQAQPVHLLDEQQKQTYFEAAAKADAFMAQQDASGLVDFVPIAGDIKGAMEVAQDPSVMGAVAVGVGLVPGIGGAASKLIKVGDPAIAIRNTPSGARADLDAAGFPGVASPGNQSGTVHANVPGADGPMDVRIMDGVPGSQSGDMSGPRMVTTLPGQPRAGVRPDGSRLSNPTRQEMRQACHTPLECD